VRATNALDLTAPFEPRSSITGAVRKAESLHPIHQVARTLEEARAVYEVYAASMRRLEITPQPWSLYQRLFAGGAARFVWAEVGGEMVSVLILLVHREVVEYHSVGNTEAGRRLQTNSWLCDRELDWARAHGVRWWHWGVSPSPAVHDFKKRWGGQELPYPVWGWILGDVDHWRRLGPRGLAAIFPSYFVLPYDQLQGQP
jgi:heme exporter protein D